MVLLPDYHLHTPLCRHASGEPSDYAAQAIRLGLREIGFTDHAPMPRDDFDNWRMRADQLELYVEQVRQAQKDFPQLEIKLGLEIDYLPGYEDWIRELAGRYPWDYLIGSVHYVSRDWALDNPEDIARWNKEDPLTVWSHYFQRLGEAAALRVFDVIGHADLPKKFGFRPLADCTPLYSGFLEIARKHGVVIELNTAGLRKDCREIYPGEAFLALARQAGVPITFGSDAHAPQEIGHGFDLALQLAKQAGYTQFCRFTQRQRQTMALP